MIHVQPSRPYQLRRACDRCHKSKLRCLRNDDDEACQRCQQAGVDCWSSPASRPPRHNQSHRVNPIAKHKQSASTSRPETLTQQANMAPDSVESSERLERAPRPETVDSTATITTTTLAPTNLLTFHDHNFDHLFLLGSDLDVSMTSMDDSAMQPCLTAPVSPFRPSPSSRSNNTSSISTVVDIPNPLPLLPAGPPSPCPIKREPPSLIHYTSKISEIGLELMKHLATIPAPTPDDNAEELLSGPDCKCPIDEVFHLTEVFVQLLEDLLPRLPPTFTGTPLTMDSPPPDRLSLDASSELLILSSYLRLIETYDRILQHIELHCQQRQRDRSASASTMSTTSTSMNTNASLHKINLPGWSIGSFSVSVKSKTQQLFMLHLIETMLDRARDLVTDVTARKATSGYRGNWECFGGMSLVIVPDLAMQAIRAREKAVQRLVQNSKTALRS